MKTFFAALLILVAVSAGAGEPLPIYSCFFIADEPKGLGIGCYALTTDGKTSLPHISLTIVQGKLTNCRIDNQGDGQWKVITCEAMRIVLDNENHHRSVAQ